MKQGDSAKGTKSRITSVAQKLFSEKGFDATGIDEIAKKTGIAKSVIYYHFKNKQSLFDSITERFVKDSFLFRDEKIKDISDGKFESVVGELLDFLINRKEMIRLIFFQSIKSSGDIPLFSLVDYFFSSLDCSGISEDIREEMKIREFYLFYLPLMNFAVFNDKWCESFVSEKEKAKMQFSKILSDLIKEGYTPLICR